MLYREKFKVFLINLQNIFQLSKRDHYLCKFILFNPFKIKNFNIQEF